MSVLDTINNRFLAGHPTDDLSAAGVLIRTFDGLEDPVVPWQPCPLGVGWLAMCARFRDRFPTSLLWPQHVNIYKGVDQGGMVIRAADAQPRCSYHMDGTTMSKGGEPCLESCANPGAKWWRCSWPAGMIQRMMEAQPTDSHNEVVLDASNWVANLPHTIEAFFAVRWPDDLIASPTLHYQRAENQNVHQKHREFLEKYGLTSDDVPLLLYDVRDGRSPPFSMWSGPVV